MSDLYISKMRKQRSLVYPRKGVQCMCIFRVNVRHLRGRKLTYTAESKGLDLRGWRKNIG